MPSSANDKSGSKVKNICEIRNLPRNATDFAYDHKAGSLFLLISESGVVSKIGSFFSAFKNPSKQDTLSSVIAFKEEPLGSLEFVKLWKHNYAAEVSNGRRILCNKG